MKKAFPNAKYDEIPFDRVDILAPDLRKATAAPPTGASIEQGRQILLAAAKASGGDALTSLSALKMTEDGKIIGPDGDVPRSVKWVVSYPDRARGEFSLSGHNIVQVCDGHSAWVQMGTETRDATPMKREFLRAISLYGGGWGLYREVLAGKISGAAIWAIGDEEIDGKKTTGGGRGRRVSARSDCFSIPRRICSSPPGTNFRRARSFRQRTALERLPDRRGPPVRILDRGLSRRREDTWSPRSSNSI